MLKISAINCYYGYIHALKDVSLEVPEGKIVTLLGANGAGKTSTLKAISGILPIKSGKIEFMGKDLTKLTVEKIVAEGIVQSPEGRQIFPELTVEENLKIGSYTRKDKKNIPETFERVYNYFPILKERKKQIAGTLSGGEQQMLAIGRALMAKPKLLLLDEPSLGLAPLIVKNIFGIIKQINEEGTTILLVEQNAVQALNIAHYGYILETGKIVHQGKAEDLKNDDKVKKAYLGGQ
ncbi:branched-chain amino acid transport system ATP-binding protein [Anaerobranca californiensis DSM 14826]|jgi:branched-chain amino acid transport system ATP-binding protein|uniref:Branched-chain amino acid transport system ATP-binding protein n=1 Tax=Anaerobranca californiensis DSM 14826 TaxID=1120989 RepID=A0A1M6NT90_9FIRM|nr:ABC transporter ATP-binding protein [Anaerobranca californiensis]SHJ98941.1 branched-chain amino acid transport system ATP-binding protein [Anaerobranca californiensis DSM 14826]